MPGHGHRGAHDTKPAEHCRMHESTWTREDAVAFLEWPGRLDAENPEELWTRAGLAPGMTVVDVGAGSGFFAFPAAKRVGPTGSVFAVDVSRELLGLIEERAKKRRVRNLAVVRSTRAKIPLPAGTADRVLFANLLHGLPAATVAEAVRILRPGGRLINEDWVKRETEGGPPVEVRLSEREAIRALERHGLRAVDNAEFGPTHYVVTMERPLRASRTR